MNIDILSPQECSRLSTLIETSQNIVITCHRSPDGDAIGSCLGWAEFLRTMGKEPTVIVPDQYPDFLHWMPNTEKIVRYDKRREQCDLLLQIADLVFCLDFNTTSRVDEMEPALLRTPGVIVLIDHHLNPDVPAELTISHPEACSTSEIVFRIVWQLGQFEKQGKHFAIPVYCGMMTDTGGFTFASTRPEIYFIISQLLTKRIDKDRIYRNVYHNYSENRLRLMGFVMYEKLVYLPEYHASFYTISKEEQKRFNFIKGDAEGLVNLPQQIKGLKLSISLREDTEKDKVIWVSLRSVDDFPCNEMAEQFYNGGGHLNASGGRLQCTLDEAVDITRKAIEAFGKKLKQLLEENNLTQKKFAAELNIAPSTVSSYVQNVREPDFKTLTNIACYFNVSVDYLLSISEETSDSYMEEELLRTFRMMNSIQKEIYVEQGRVVIKTLKKYNN